MILTMEAPLRWTWSLRLRLTVLGTIVLPGGAVAANPMKAGV